jgi:hypothetical protein
MSSLTLGSAITDYATKQSVSLSGQGLVKQASG